MNSASELSKLGRDLVISVNYFCRRIASNGMLSKFGR